MRIILRESVKGLGETGEIKEVKKGYANNYLFPRKLAYPATEKYLKIIENEKRAKEKEKERKEKELNELKEKLNNVSCTIAMKVGEDEKLFGSVTSQHIVEKLKEQGINIDKKSIILEEPIKKLGVYHIPVKLAPEITAEVKVWIIKE